eukprot:1157537-Pelagomonas_calceolata.AAC.3
MNGPRLVGRKTVPINTRVHVCSAGEALLPASGHSFACAQPPVPSSHVHSSLALSLQTAL